MPLPKNGSFHQKYQHWRNQKRSSRTFGELQCFVLDQRFRENSSVSLINTSVMRSGDFRDANATGLFLDLTNKKNTFNVFGSTERKLGFRKSKQNSVSKEMLVFNQIIKGHQFGAEVFLRDKNYDINDLGFTGQTNYVNYSANFIITVICNQKAISIN